MPNKLTDSEIVKALECCQKVLPNCNECPVEEKERIMCCDLIKGKAIDLINRLQAENERLKPFEDKIAEFNSHIRVEDMLVFASSLEEWLEFCDNLKAEAYKECIEKVKALFPSDNEPYQYWEIHEDADNLLKKLVGEGGENK